MPQAACSAWLMTGPGLAVPATSWVMKGWVTPRRFASPVLVRPGSADSHARSARRPRVSAIARFTFAFESIIHQS